jgi:hypothetical protein
VVLLYGIRLGGAMVPVALHIGPGQPPPFDGVGYGGCAGTRPGGVGTGGVEPPQLSPSHPSGGGMGEPPQSSPSHPSGGGDGVQEPPQSSPSHSGGGVGMAGVCGGLCGTGVPS